MAAQERIIFGTEPPSEKQLVFSLLGNNRLRWQVLPAGEEGRAGNFRDTQERQVFIDTYARRMGFSVSILNDPTNPK